MLTGVFIILLILVVIMGLILIPDKYIMPYLATILIVGLLKLLILGIAIFMY